MAVSINGGIPQKGGFILENLNQKWMMTGGNFRKPPYSYYLRGVSRIKSKPHLAFTEEYQDFVYVFFVLKR